MASPYSNYSSPSSSFYPSPGSVYSRNSSGMASSSSSGGSAAQTSSKAKQQIQNLMDHIYHGNPDMKIVQFDLLPASPHKTYALTTSDGTHFLLKTSPPSGARLLRCETESPAIEAPVLDLINRSSNFTPRLVASAISHPNHPLSSAFLLRGFMTGVPLSQVAHRFTTFDREQIDRQIGAVIRSVTASRSASYGLPTRVASGTGHSTWKQAFKSLFDSALTDAEDARLTLPYDSIRYYMGVHMNALDGVTEARLVPLKAGVPETVLIDEPRKAVIGVVGWSETLWGDAAMGEVFEDPSSGFWTGFGSTQALGTNPEGAEIRREMYIVYRSIISVLKCYHRRSMGMDDSDFRRAMNRSLNVLAAHR